MKRTLLLVLLCAALILPSVFAPAGQAAGSSGLVVPLQYIDENGNVASTTDYKELNNHQLGYIGGIYTASEDITFDWAEFNVLDDILLILKNNVTVTMIHGISIDDGVTLTITGQPTGNNDTLGKLVVSNESGRQDAVLGWHGNGANSGESNNIVINGGDISVTYGNGQSGIGWSADHVTINGGKVTVKGTCNTTATDTYNQDRAAISGNVTINGGTVNAQGQNGPGIGSNVTINGGNVTATSVRGAAIGGSYKTANGNVTINGGTVDARSTYGAGIGTGRETAPHNSSVVIRGGSVTARSACGAGIGGGYGASGVNVRITGGTVDARGGMSGEGYIPPGKKDGMGPADILAGYGAAGIGAGAPVFIRQTMSNHTFCTSYTDGGSVEITGGTVTITPGNAADKSYGGQAIGNNVRVVSEQGVAARGGLIIGNGMEVSLGSHIYYSNEREDAARNCAIVTIKPCTNQHGDGDACAYCGLSPLPITIRNDYPDIVTITTDKDAYYPDETIHVSVASKLDPLDPQYITQLLWWNIELNNFDPEPAVEMPSLTEQLEFFDPDLFGGGMEDLPPNTFDIKPRLQTLDLGFDMAPVLPEYFEPHNVTIEVDPESSGHGTASLVGSQMPGGGYLLNNNVYLRYEPQDGAIVSEALVIDNTTADRVPFLRFGTPYPDSAYIGTDFRMPPHDVTVRVRFEQIVASGENLPEYNEYSVALAASPANGGTVSGGGSYKEGAAVTVHAVPAEGCTFENWTMDGQAVSTQPDYTFIVMEDCSLTANFVRHTVTAQTYGPGTLTASRTVASAGQEITLYPVPETGYQFSTWVYDGTDYTIDENNTFIMPDRDVTIRANFTICQYDIAASSNLGDILFDGPLQDWGNEVTVTAPRKDGFQFVHWVEDAEDGGLISAEASYTFTAERDLRLLAIYKPVYDLSFGASVSGAAAGQGPDIPFTVTLSDPSVNGVRGGVTFADGVAQVTLRSGNTVSVTGLDINVTATIQPTAPQGYTFVNWTGENGNSADETLVFAWDSEAEADAVLQMTANFDRIYGLTVTSGGNGTAFANVSRALEGTEIRLTANPGDGYLLQGWQVVSGGVTIQKIYKVWSDGAAYWEYTFSMPASDVVIRADFAQPYAIETEYCAAWLQDDNYNGVIVQQAVPGTVLRVSLDVSGNIPTNLYFVDGQFTAEGVTLYAEDYETKFVMPENDVRIAAVMQERMNPTIDLSAANSVEVAREVAEGLIYRYVAEPDMEAPQDIDLNGDGSNDIRVTYGGYPEPEIPEEGEEWPEPVLLPSFAERLAGVDALTEPVAVVFDDYGSPWFMPYYGCVINTVPTLPTFGPAAFTLPAALTIIEESAFEGNIALTVVEAGEGVTTIGADAFKGCTNLTQIKVPANCAIDSAAFTGCGTVYVFAPEGGSAQTSCQGIGNCVFVPVTED